MEPPPMARTCKGLEMSTPVERASTSVSVEEIPRDIVRVDFESLLTFCLETEIEDGCIRKRSGKEETEHVTDTLTITCL
jgi:hypothetical protein